MGVFMHYGDTCSKGRATVDNWNNACEAFDVKGCRALSSAGVGYFVLTWARLGFFCAPIAT